MVARSYRGFSLASPDPLTTVFTFLHITPSPGELNFNGLINGLPCPLASCWYQSMWGSSRTRVGLTCSFSHLPACGVNLRWLCSSAKDHSFRLGRKTTHSVADPLPHLYKPRDGNVLRTPTASPANNAIPVGSPYPCPHLCKMPLHLTLQMFRLSVLTASCQDPS